MPRVLALHFILNIFLTPNTDVTSILPFRLPALCLPAFRVTLVRRQLQIRFTDDDVSTRAGRLPVLYVKNKPFDH